MRQTFTITQEQYHVIIEACKPVPLIMLQSGMPPSPQENANRAWEQLGKELGFAYMSVKPGGNKLEFTAEPLANTANKEDAGG